MSSNEPLRPAAEDEVDLPSAEAPVEAPPAVEEPVEAPPAVEVPIEGPSAGQAPGPPGPSAGPAPSPASERWEPTITAPPADYTEAGVPSLDFVRDKIEGRYANALGASELAESVSPEVKDMRKQQAEREEKAHDRLEEIRRSLRGR